jgi:hypothetical protein
VGGGGGGGGGVGLVPKARKNFKIWIICLKHFV